ncbi:MAG: hypothetical protein ACE1Y1_06325, partial [Nitrosomonadaceae bacterium]
ALSKLFLTERRVLLSPPQLRPSLGGTVSGPYGKIHWITYNRTERRFFVEIVKRFTYCNVRKYTNKYETILMERTSTDTIIRSYLLCAKLDR